MDILYITDMAIHSVLFVIGLSGNIFILIVHFLEWLKTREHNPCNLIINSIGISNICLQIANDVYDITYYLCPDAYLEEWANYLLLALVSSLSLSSLWCSTCLCFYYCVKIVNLNGSLFYKIKAKLPVVVPWLLVFSVVLSWSVGMSAYYDLYTGYSVSALNITGNVTLEESFYPYESKCNCIFSVYILVASLAFAIIFLAGGTIITSLCKHMLRMRQTNEGLGHSRIRTHLSAAKTVTALMILYLIFYCAFSCINNSIYSFDFLTIIICYMVISIFPTGNALILITGNRKLLTALKKVLGVKSSVINTEVTVTTY
ncbi:PREDICTED: taste receptor type 2 member 7-like [Nanorana parkeri]|uniref:taste receptor type 2 member 7-like n=1 Tax=Nanorana parkeri TaxID=125878 RepID=UPI0008548526|nr:PREDICTED: taste receptor type 2 member 7-like [Nanorana parkeri]